MLGCIQPMSSPMMKRMLGFRCCCCACCCAAAGTLAAVMGTNDASSPRKSFLVIRMACFLAPGDGHADVRRDGCNHYCVVRLGSPCARAMGGGFIHIV